MNEVGKRIKSLRQMKGWSQGDAAKLLNISIPAFSKIEGDITGINIDRLVEIAKIFDVTVIELLEPEAVRSPTLADELKAAKKTIEKQAAKIFQLQEHVITLYEELHQVKKQQPDSSIQE